MDNYLDGGYHVSFLHKDLASGLDINSYRSIFFGPFQNNQFELIKAKNKKILRLLNISMNEWNF